MKITINNPKTGDSFQKEIEKADAFVGKKIGDKISGGEVGLDGYSLKITGGTDNSGCPLRPDIPGSRKVKALLPGGTGVRYLKKGLKIKKTVAGNTITKSTAQVNTVIEQAGPKSLEDSGLVAKKPANKKAAKAQAKKAKPAEAKAEEVKPA